MVEPAPTATGSLVVETAAQTQKSPVDRNRGDLFTSTSMVRQSAAESVGQSLENALDQMFEAYNSQYQSVKSLVQVIFQIHLPSCLAPKYSVDETTVESAGYLLSVRLF